MKKFLSILLAAMMLFAMVGTAFAANTFTINQDNADHTYEVYQIFKGTKSVNEDGDPVLSTVIWGSSVTTAGQTALGEAQDVADNLVGASTAAALNFVDTLMNGDVNVDDDTYLGDPVATLTNANSFTASNLPDGYYLVIDQKASLEGKDEAYTEYILQILDNVTMDPKDGDVEIEKKVADINDTDDTAISEDYDYADLTYADSADHDIGDTVRFKLTATLPENYTSYETYYLQFNDTLSTGLTYKGNVKAYVGDTEIAPACYTVDTSTSPFTITFANLKPVTDDQGNATYGCTNKDGNEIALSNGSEIVVYYEATLNENAIVGSAGNPNTVYLKYSNNPNAGGEGDRGKTPTDTVIVFTYKVVVNKVAKNNEGVEVPLAGAEFTLQKLLKDGTWKTYGVVKTDDGATFNFKGLDDGIYKLTEIAAPVGYNAIAPIYFEVAASHSEEADAPTLDTLTVTAPTGDNLPAEVTTGDLGTFTPVASTGEITTSILNNKGATLPETGGIGTTLFYLFGSIMAAGSALILVVRRRAEAEEE